MPIDDAAPQTAMPPTPVRPDMAGPALVGRFAPSPTGDLHLGNALTALAAWARARSVGGAFVVRMEDLDLPRCVPGAADRILADLERLGIDWDGPVVYQSTRTALYRHAADQLIDRGCLYACRCSRKDLERLASAPAFDDDGPAYPGICAQAGLALDDANCAWRFRVRAGETSFVDAVQGLYAQDVAATVGDFVVRRKDGLFAYQLAVVVDDIQQGVTEVVRGVDLLSSTPRQIQLYQALGGVVPTYAHMPLLRDGRGEKISKRNGAQPMHLRTLWSNGTTTAQLIAQMARAIGIPDVGDAMQPNAFAAALSAARALRTHVVPTLPAAGG